MLGTWGLLVFFNNLSKHSLWQNNAFYWLPKIDILKTPPVYLGGGGLWPLAPATLTGPRLDIRLNVLVFNAYFNDCNIKACLVIFKA